MIRFQGHWIYSRRDNLYFTLFGDSFSYRPMRRLTAASYRSVEWENLSDEDCARLREIAKELRRHTAKRARAIKKDH
jgi:hypothetical protein